MTAHEPLMAVGGALCEIQCLKWLEHQRYGKPKSVSAMPAVTTTAATEPAAKETAVEANVAKVMMVKELKPEPNCHGNAVGVIRQ